MGRDYTRQQYLDKIDHLKKLIPDISLSTDIIVGFPGETEKDFLDTLDILDRVRYTNIFSFRYSRRPHTAAAKYTQEVPLETKKQRLIQLQKLQRDIQLEAHRSLIGQKMKVLCMGKNKKHPGTYVGRNEAFQVVNFTSPTDKTGHFLFVEITESGPYSLTGKA
jgi:tRNA-2-methylthio-N6-dimethylallyladenosine synthase